MVSEMLGMHINMRLQAVLGEELRFRFEVIMFGGVIPDGMASAEGGCFCSFPTNTPMRSKLSRVSHVL